MYQYGAWNIHSENINEKTRRAEFPLAKVLRKAQFRVPDLTQDIEVSGITRKMKISNWSTLDFPDDIGSRRAPIDSLLISRFPTRRNVQVGICAPTKIKIHHGVIAYRSWMSHSIDSFIPTYQGAKNLMKTVLPSVNSS